MLGFDKRQKYFIDEVNDGSRSVWPARLWRGSRMSEPGGHCADLYAAMARIGKGSSMVLATLDCHGVHGELVSRGVRFLSEPSEFPWDITALLEHLHGNGITLFQSIRQADSVRND